MGCGEHDSRAVVYSMPITISSRVRKAPCSKDSISMIENAVPRQEREPTHRYITKTLP